MDVLMIASGLWRWTAFHPEWKEDVGCVYYASSEAVVLIDPLVPQEAEERFWNALDRDVERAGARTRSRLRALARAQRAHDRQALRRALVGAVESTRSRHASGRKGDRPVPPWRRAAGRRRGIPDGSFGRGRFLAARASRRRPRRRPARRRA